MALKRFVARLGLESGGGVAFPVTSINSGTVNPYQALDTDFLIDVTGNTDPDIYLPEILNTGEQRQIIGVKNSSEFTLAVWDYGGGTNLDTLFRGDVAIYQVTQNYSTWQRISDTSIIGQSGAKGTSVRVSNNNSVADDSLFSTISGGTGNSINLNSTNSTISGGELNTIGTLSWRSTVAGGSRNSIDGSHHSVISGGARNSIYGVAGPKSSGYFIGGGSGNGVTGTAQYSSVVGGLGNTAGSAYSAILGGYINTIGSGSTGSAILGGENNQINSSAQYGAILGGRDGVLSHNDSFVMGRGIASVRENTTHVDNLYTSRGLSYNDSIPVGFASGEVVYFGSTQSGVGMTAGFIYEYGGTGSWGIARADTNANASGLLGIALGSTPSAGILLKGFARYNLSSYTNMGVTGGQQYLSKTSTGAFSGTPPGASGDIVRIIGYCVNPVTDTLYFSPDTTWITRTS